MIFCPHGVTGELVEVRARQPKRRWQFAADGYEHLGGATRLGWRGDGTKAE
jgi:hypothetical protein